MPFYKRKNVTPVYIPELDAEHLDLYEAMEDLREAVADGAQTEEAQSAARRLADHVTAHLAREERMMRAARYPAFDWHRQSHDTVRKRAKAASDCVEAGDVAGLVEAVDFLKAWLRDHTGLHDRMMGAYLRNFERTGGRVS